MKLTSFLLILSFQFSFCPEPPRMVRHFSYTVSQNEATSQMRQFLEQNGFIIEHYAPESGYILTTPLENEINLSRYKYQLSIQIEDKVKIYMISSREILTRGSEVSIGGGSFDKKQKMDKLPYRVQKAIFSQFATSLDNAGLHLIKS